MIPSKAHKYPCDDPACKQHVCITGRGLGATRALAVAEEIARLQAAIRLSREKVAALEMVLGAAREWRENMDDDGRTAVALYDAVDAYDKSARVP